MMKEAETWTLSVHAKTNKFNLILKAKRLLFPNFYEISFKLKTHPRISSLNKSKTLKSKFITILKKCRFRNIKNAGTGANRNSTSRCISSAGPKSGNVAKISKWISSGEKNVRGIVLQSYNVFQQLMGINVIYWFLMILCAVSVSYCVIAAKQNNFICNAAVDFLYKMFGELG